MLTPAVALNAISLVAQSLSGKIEGEAVLIVAGSMAGLLTGELPPDRLTGDCDILWTEDKATWLLISAAADQAASKLGLPTSWLNCDCTIFADRLPLGWRARCEPVVSCPPIRVVRLSRGDLMGAKLISAARRTQDREDLRTLAPTGAEIEFLAAHIDRVEAEDLSGQSYDAQRTILAELRGGAL